VLLVSHDRDFLDRVVTSTIAAEGNGRWIEYAGGYTDMLAQREPAGRRTPPPKASGARQSRPVREIRGQPAARPSRLSFNDRGALEMLPARIPARIAATDADCWAECRPGRPGPVCARPGTVSYDVTGACRRAR
jgi:ATPase subunit of ABC transporter with duplicated ATPase domains